MYTNRDVVLRCIIAAFLKEMTNKLTIFNVHSELNITKIKVPMFYGLQGQELMYIEDYYDQDTDGCKTTQELPVPRGMVTVEGVSINQSEEAGWAQVDIPIDLDGFALVLRTRCKMVPITLETQVQVICSNHIELLKIIESAMARIWVRSNAFKVNCMGFPIEANFIPSASYDRKFPIDISKDTTDKEYSTTMGMELHSVVPVFEYGVSLSDAYYIVSCLLKDEETRSKIQEHPIVSLTRTSSGSLGVEVCGQMMNINVNLIDQDTDELIEQRIITSTDKS